MKKLVLMLPTIATFLAVPVLVHAQQVIRGRDPSGNARVFEISDKGIPIINSEPTAIFATTLTASANSADQTNYSARGVRLFLDVTAASGMPKTLDVKVQTKDPVSGKYLDLPGAAFPTKTAAGSDDLVVYPGVTESMNSKVSNVLPRTWRVVATVGGGAPSFTFTLSATYVQ